MHRAVLFSSALALAPAVALAAPDPLSAGGIQQVQVTAERGNVVVFLRETQHIELDGKEGDAKRQGKLLIVNRASGDVTLTIPKNVDLRVRTTVGRIMVSGAVDKAELIAGEGDIEFDAALSEAAQLVVETAQGNVLGIVIGKTPFTLQASATEGAVEGQELSKPGAPASIRATAKAGSVMVQRVSQ